jgi:hypothetical protein
LAKTIEEPVMLRLSAFGRAQKTYLAKFGRLLRLSPMGARQHQSNQQKHSCAMLFHLITRSAAPGTFGGIVRRFG